MTNSFVATALPDPHTRPEFYQNMAFKRSFAWLIDTVLVLILGVVFLPFTAFTAIFFFPLFLTVVGFVYRWLTLANGSSTWGMRLMSIEFRDFHCEKLDNRTSALHAFGTTMSYAIFPAQLISILLMLFSQRKQGLTDFVLGTTSINKPL